MEGFDGILELVNRYGYGVLLPAAIIEGPFATVAAGGLASAGLLKLPVAYLVVVLGDVIGDVLHYVAGRWGGRPIVRGYGPRVGVTPERFSALERHFREYPVRTILFGKCQAWASLILLLGGAARMPFAPFLTLCIAATAVKSGILILAGYCFGELLSEADLDFYLKAAAVILFVLGLFAVRAHFKRRTSLGAETA